MWTVISVTLQLLVFVVVKGDVVHFLPPSPVLLEPPQPFNGFGYLDTDHWSSSTGGDNFAPPQPETTTTRNPLPEIIINKSGFRGHSVAHPHEVDYGDSVVVHNQYLPPTPPTTTTTTTQKPLQDEPNYYLPPTSGDRNPNNGRELYYYPKPPVQFDEPFLDPVYLPPPTIAPPPPPPPPVLQYLPPSGYLPPSSPLLGKSATNRSENDFFSFSNSIRSPLRLELVEMKCLSNGEDGFFRTKITVQSFINTMPVFEDVTGCSHRLEIVRNQIRIQIPANEFKSCGVTTCGQKNEELCTRIRFPQIDQMRTVSDAILALQCKPQERTVTRTHALRMGVASDR